MLAAVRDRLQPPGLQGQQQQPADQGCRSDDAAAALVELKPVDTRQPRPTAVAIRCEDRRLTWAIFAIVPFVPFVYVLTGNDFV